MAHFVFLMTVCSAVGLPMIAIVLLLCSKLAVGNAARRAERRFLAALVVMLLVTARTVTTDDATWLIHTFTLAGMVIGGLWIPGQSSQNGLESWPEPASPAT